MILSLRLYRGNYFNLNIIRSVDLSFLSALASSTRVLTYIAHIQAYHLFGPPFTALEALSN